MAQRMYIYTADIAQLTGKSYRSAAKVVSKIKKEKLIRRKWILINEYAEYMNIPEEIIRKNMKE